MMKPLLMILTISAVSWGRLCSGWVSKEPRTYSSWVE